MRTLVALALLLLAAHGARANTVEVATPIVPRPWHSHPREHYVNAQGQLHKVHAALDEVLNPAYRDLKRRILEQAGHGDDVGLQVHHVMLPMRDGVQLSTFVIRPAMQPGERRGAMLARSPYGPTSDQIADIFTALNGFVAVIQDQRGTFLSQGEFTMWCAPSSCFVAQPTRLTHGRHNDATDGQDTMDWIVQQEWSDGNVYSAGISADGCGSAAMVLSQPKPLKGQLIQWASADGHETCYPGGAFREGLVTGWMSMMATMTKGHSLKSVRACSAHWAAL